MAAGLEGEKFAACFGTISFYREAEAEKEAAGLERVVKAENSRPAFQRAFLFQRRKGWVPGGIVAGSAPGGRVLQEEQLTGELSD